VDLSNTTLRSNLLGAALAVAAMGVGGCSAPSAQMTLPPSSLNYGIPYAQSAATPYLSFPLGDKSHIVIVQDRAANEWSASYNLEDDLDTYFLIHTWTGGLWEMAFNSFEFDYEHRAIVYTDKAEGFPESEHWNAYRFDGDTKQNQLLYVADQWIHRILPFENNAAVIVLDDQSVYVARNNRLATVRDKPDPASQPRPYLYTRVACSRDFVVYTDHAEGTDRTVVLANPGVRQKDTLHFPDGVFGLVCAPDSSRVAVSSCYLDADEIARSRTEIYSVTKDERGRFRFTDEEPIMIEGAQHAMFVPDRDLVITGHVDNSTYERWTSLYELNGNEANNIGTIACPWYLLRGYGWVTSDAISVHITGLPGVLWTQPLPE
jgi:hypothetical protein